MKLNKVVKLFVVCGLIFAVVSCKSREKCPAYGKAEMKQTHSRS